MTTSIFKQLPATEVANILHKIKRQIQLESKQIVITDNEKILGFLLSLKSSDRALLKAKKDGETIAEYPDMTISAFRTHIRINKGSPIKLYGIDKMCLVSNNKRIMTFLSVKFQRYLDIPVPEVAHKLLEIDAGLVTAGSVISPAEKIKDRLNKLAAEFYYCMGYKVRDGFDFTKSKHPQERICYRMAEIAYEEFTGDRPDYEGSE